MQSLCTELDVAAHQGVISVAIGTVVAASVLDSGEVDTPGEDQVELMPVFGSRMSLRDSMLRLRVEEGVTDA